MGHRALVAYRRPDYLYDVRYSHWGGDGLALVDELSRDAPLARGAVDSSLLADAVALERVLTDYLDPCVYEALYLVSPEFAVTAYRVCWLEWSDGRESGRGAIVATAPGERDREVRTWFRAIKTTLADVVAMGIFPRRAASSYLEARVYEDEDGHVYTYGDAADGVRHDAAVDRWFEEQG
ncbi:DUF6735 family protein [Natronobeatus ordinarius]|uniref:DUF6735 family protein n=1 Tax=Natronobeatus ordinarius TaxID=2963433 RepID=UPI0020CF3A94|nr:DUF6735 family protein [Natronobeatus ordinarius]